MTPRGGGVRWRVSAVALAVAYISHALYFDWSDVAVHGTLAIFSLAIAVPWPRAAAAMLGLLLALVAIAYHAVPHPEWTRQAMPGHAWSEARARLGEPTYESLSAGEARQMITGYAVPSPLRFRHAGPVAIYVRGEHALWVFHDGRTVVETFVAGS